MKYQLIRKKMLALFGSFALFLSLFNCNVCVLRAEEKEALETYTLSDINVPSMQKTRAYVIGYEDGLFYPAKELTRAEMAAMVYELTYNGTLVNYDVLNKFEDVEINDWFSAAVAYLTNKNILEDSDGEFKPHEKVTKAEATQILFNALCSYQETSDSTKELKLGEKKVKFTDIADNSMANAINHLASNDMVTGYEDGTFKPNNNITRADFVYMISKVFSRGDSWVTDTNKSFADVLESHWAYKFIMNAANGNRSLIG